MASGARQVRAEQRVGPGVILTADCIDAMAALEPDSIDAIVTDPPYGLGFMGKQWDDLPPGPEFAEQAFRVLKPGGHMLAFGGTRTVHRLAVAIEDAGFEIRDQIVWMYGSGFPKSHDVSKGIDKAAGAERCEGAREWSGGGRTGGIVGGKAPNTRTIYDAPATPEAQKWQGWGTALKPAHEPIVLARKPLIGTVAKNVTRFGTGALNIDGCRVRLAEGEAPYEYPNGKGGDHGPVSFIPANDFNTKPLSGNPQGRWPANVLLDPEAGAMLDAQSGERPSGSRDEGVRTEMGFHGADGDGGPAITASTGGASSFFYTAKSSSAERSAGLDDRCSHPTVKPISLMRYLVRLVTPPDGTVLDPFTGSGTTGIAAHLEGFDFIGIEREAEYAEIAEARIAWWSQHEGDTTEILVRAGLVEKAETKHRESGQLGLEIL